MDEAQPSGRIGRIPSGPHPDKSVATGPAMLYDGGMFRPGKRPHLVVVGGVAAGMSAAAEARRVDPSLLVTVIERLPWVSYAKCPMPRFLAGRGPSPVEAAADQARRFREERNIDVRTGTECLELNPLERFVRVRDLDRGGEYAIDWDRLILATGTAAVMPQGFCPGDNVFRLGAPPDAHAIAAYLAERSPRRAAVVGGGAVGVDMAWVLRLRGLAVTLYERRDTLLGDVSPEVAAAVRARLERHGVAVATGEPVGGIAEGGRCVAVARPGREEPADLFLLAAGAAPETTLARSAGIRVGTTGGISVDAKLTTNLRHIYACGDCAEFRCAVTGRPLLSRVGTTAWRSGYAAGANAAGEFRRFGGIENTMISHVFGAFHARTGLGPAEAQAALGAGYDSVAVEWTEMPAEEPSRAEVYLERRTGRIVGAQIFGTGNAKRIDTLALALRTRIPLAELADADFAYTPELCAARDPIQLIGRAWGERRRAPARKAPPR